MWRVSLKTYLMTYFSKGLKIFKNIERIWVIMFNAVKESKG